MNEVNDPTGGRFCYVSFLGGFYGWCPKCSRVMFHKMRFRRYVNQELRATVRCEECGTGTRLAAGKVLDSPRGTFWQEYRRL